MARSIRSGTRVLVLLNFAKQSDTRRLPERQYVDVATSVAQINQAAFTQATICFAAQGLRDGVFCIRGPDGMFISRDQRPERS